VEIPSVSLLAKLVTKYVVVLVWTVAPLVIILAKATMPVRRILIHESFSFTPILLIRVNILVRVKEAVILVWTRICIPILHVLIVLVIYVDIVIAVRIVSHLVVNRVNIYISR
jgi:hypothetical protein